MSTEPISRPPFPHRALLIAEVLDIILDELVNDKRSISHLAFTCKTLAEPSLDRLWALNDSLEPFLSLLPKELVLDESSIFQVDRFTTSNLPLQSWAIFDNYARRARRLYAKTVTMNPHRVYSSIYRQLVDIRPDVDIFPNLIVLAVHAKSAPSPNLRLFPSSLRCLTLTWANRTPELDVVLWSSVMDRLLVDSPLIENIHFEGSPKEPLHSLIPLSFPQLRKISIKPSPLDPNVLHKYAHKFSTSPIRELDIRFVHWPDTHLQPIPPVFPSLTKLTIDGLPSHTIGFIRLLSSPVLRELTIPSQCERSEDALIQYAQLLMLLAEKYRGVFRTFKLQHPLLCHDQASLESFLRAVRALADAGADTLQLNLIVGWQDLAREVQDMIEPSRWAALKHFRITSRRANALWSWTAGNALFG